MHVQQNNITKNLSIIIQLVSSYGCTTHHSPGTNRKVWGTRLDLKPCWSKCGFCASSSCKLVTKALHVGPTGRFTRSQIP